MAPEGRSTRSATTTTPLKTRLRLCLAGNGAGVRATPLGYPATLGKVRVFIFDYSAPTTAFLVRLYDDDGPTAGGTMLAEAQTNAQIGNTWVDVDFTSLGLTFSDGDFYIAVIRITGANPGPMTYVGLDTNGSLRSLMAHHLDSGATWDQYVYAHVLPGTRSS